MTHVPAILCSSRPASRAARLSGLLLGLCLDYAGTEVVIG